MTIISWIIWSITCTIAIMQIPLMKGEGIGVTILALRFFVLLLIAALITVLTPISKFNLLWWIPASYVINIYSSRYFNRNSSKKKLSLPEFGAQISWKQAYKQVMKVVDFKRSIKRINSEGKQIAKYSFEPYAYLIIQSPLLNEFVQLPIIHKDDFLFLKNARTKPRWKKCLLEYELLVTYYPKSITEDALSTSADHVLHFAIATNGTVEALYSRPQKITDDELSKLFNGFCRNEWLFDK